MKTLFAVLVLFVSIGCVKNSQVTDAGVVATEPVKLESVPESVNPQITDSVTQSKPAVEVADAGVTPQ
jgi:hypothetical protein